MNNTETAGARLSDAVAFLQKYGQPLAEKEAQTERLLRMLDGFLIHAPLVAFAKDDKFRFVYVNPRCYVLFAGLTAPAEWVGRTDADVFGTDVQATVRPNDEYVLATGDTLEVVERVPTPDGTIVAWRVWKFRFAANNKFFVGGVATPLSAPDAVEPQFPAPNTQPQGRTEAAAQ